MPLSRCIATLFLGVTFSVLVAAPAAVAQKRPNILLILADDMGYSDISPYGGEIDRATAVL